MLSHEASFWNYPCYFCKNNKPYFLEILCHFVFIPPCMEDDCNVTHWAKALIVFSFRIYNNPELYLLTLFFFLKKKQELGLYIYNVFMFSILLSVDFLKCMHRVCTDLNDIYICLLTEAVLDLSWGMWTLNCSMRGLVPTRMESLPAALGEWSPSHSTTKEVPFAQI